VAVHGCFAQLLDAFIVSELSWDEDGLGFCGGGDYFLGSASVPALEEDVRPA
jgi:hypothetical protein